ncbi:MAG: Na+/H+ antiporter [Phycisphaerales bacterium]|nr:Na+/H+ antiporter [Phycisphaerales bacterium]
MVVIATVMVAAGAAVSLVPHLPVVRIDSQYVMLLFLPPLLYSAAWRMPWRDFRQNLWPILMLAIGFVVFTTCAVAFVMHTAPSAASCYRFTTAARSMGTSSIASLRILIWNCSVWKGSGKSSNKFAEAGDWENRRELEWASSRSRPERIQDDAITESSHHGIKRSNGCSHPDLRDGSCSRCAWRGAEGVQWSGLCRGC